MCTGSRRQQYYLSMGGGYYINTINNDNVSVMDHFQVSRHCCDQEKNVVCKQQGLHQEEICRHQYRNPGDRN